MATSVKITNAITNAKNVKKYEKNEHSNNLTNKEQQRPMK